MQVLNLNLILFLLISFGLQAKTLKVDTLRPSVTNGDLNLERDGTGDIVVGDYTGVLRADSGTLSTTLVDLTTDITSVLGIGNGGTNSSAALANDKIMYSQGGQIVESGISLTSSENITGVNDLTVNNNLNVGVNAAVVGNLNVSGTTTLNNTLTGPLRTDAGVVSTSNIDLTSEVTGVLPIANGGSNSSTALTNDKVMYSQGGAIVESGLTLDASSNLSGIANLTATGTTTLNTGLTGVLKAASGVVSASDVDLTAEVTGVLPKANGGVPTDGTDGQVLTWDTGTYAWAENAGGSGSGRLNYAEGDSSTFEEGIGSWTKSNATGFDVTSQSVTLLRGTNSGEFETLAPYLLGDYVYLPFTIDNTDQASILEVSFDYTTSSGVADGDWTIALYDVTNAKLIQTSNNEITAGEKAYLIKYFQTSPDSTSYQLRLIPTFASATVGKNIFLDNVIITPDLKGGVGSSSKSLAEYRGNGGTSLTADVTPIDFSTKEYDLLGEWDGDTFTPKFTGYYNLKGRIGITTTSNAGLNAYVDSGGGFSFVKAIEQDEGSFDRKSFDGTFYLEAGHSIQLRSSTSVTLQNNSAVHFIEISRVNNELNGSSVGGEILDQVRYFNGENVAGGNIPNNTTTVVRFINSSYNNIGTYDATTGRFQPNKSGWYDFNIRWLWASTSWTTGNITFMGLRKNGFTYSFIARKDIQNSITTFIPLEGADSIYLTPDDYVEVVVSQNTGAALGSLNNNQNTYLNISRRPETTNGVVADSIKRGTILTFNGQQTTSGTIITFNNLKEGASYRISGNITFRNNTTSNTAAEVQIKQSADLVFAMRGRPVAISGALSTDVFSIPFVSTGTTLTFEVFNVSPTGTEIYGEGNQRYTHAILEEIDNFNLGSFFQ